MGEEIKNVQLKFSCPANWDNMSAAEGGRHCDTCQKKAYDFTNSKAEEFQRILAENSHNVCGRFTRDQMHAQPVILPFWKKWLAAALVLLGINYWGNKAVAQHVKADTLIDKTQSPIKPTEFIVGEIQSQDSSSIPLANKIFGGSDVDQMPEFPGGIDKFYYYLSSKLRTKEDYSGRVIVSFVVEKKGDLTNCKIEKGGLPSINEEILKLLSTSAEWHPGIRQGKEVRVRYFVAIRIN